MIRSYSNSRFWFAMEDGELEKAGLTMPPDFHEFEEDFKYDGSKHCTMKVSTSHGTALMYVHPLVYDHLAALFVAYGRIEIRYLHELEALFEDGMPRYRNPIDPLQRAEQYGLTV